MENMSIFRISLIVFFAILAVAGVITFSTFRGTSSTEQIGEVTIWGTFDQVAFDRYLTTLTDSQESFSRVEYIQVDAVNFEQDVLEAMASGRSPDLLFIPDYELYSYLDKVYTLNSEQYAKSTFINNFVDGAEIFFQNGGIVGLPLASDPLVMFWNRDLFASAGVPRPPAQWNDFYELAETLSVVDQSLNVRRAAVALGETANIDYYRHILATLLLQTGNPIIQSDGRGGFQALLAGGRDTESAKTALNFYTIFSDASQDVYSWNRSLPSSEDAFLASRLAVHFAPISRLVPLRQKNPNLNFAVAEIPNLPPEDATRKSVYAPVWGFVILRLSDNPGGALQTAVALTGNEPMREFALANNLAPVRRDLIAESSPESYQDIIKKQSLYAQTFIDPDSATTNRIFSDMVESITSGQRSADNSIFVSNSSLQNALQQ